MAAEKKKEYVELRIPKFFNGNLITPLLVLTLIIMAFAIGMLYTKLQYLEKGGDTNTGTTNSGNTVTGKNVDEVFTDYAKDLKLDTKKFGACLKDGKYTERVTKDTSEAATLGVNATPGFFVNGKFVGGAYPYESFKEIIDKELNGTGSEDPLAYSEVLQQAYNDPNQKSFDPVPKSIEIGSSATKGNANAKVTIIEYSDFQCPFCQRSFATMNQILNDYKNDVRLVYKHLPIASIHPNAQKAAEAVECANEQKKFWEYHDVLFNKQQEWSPLPQATS